MAGSIFALQTAGSGVAVYALPVYLAAFLARRLAEPGALSIAGTMFFVASACSGVLFGYMPRQYAVVILASAIALGGAALTTLAVEPRGAVIIVAFAGLGLFSNAFVVVGTTILVHVFDGRPTTGMALATSGSSAGGVLVSPLLALALRGGLRMTLLGLAGLFVLCSAGALVVLAVAMRRADRIAAAPGPADSRPDSPAVAPSLLTQWPLLAGFSLMAASQLGATSYCVAAGMSRGFAGSGLAVMVLTGSAVASRWLGAAGIRRFGLERWAVISFAGQAIGVLLIGVAQTGWVLFVGCLLIGQSLGNTLLLRSQVVVDVFGRSAFAQRFGQFMTCASLGSAVGPFVLGQALAATGSYLDAYLAGFALNLLALPLLVPWLRSTGSDRSDRRSGQPAPVADLAPVNHSQEGR